MVSNNFDDFMGMKTFKKIVDIPDQIIKLSRKRVFQISDLGVLTKRNSLILFADETKDDKIIQLPKLNHLIGQFEQTKQVVQSQSTPKMGHCSKIDSQNLNIFLKEIDIQNYFQLNDKTTIKQSQLLMKRKNIKLKSIHSSEVFGQESVVHNKNALKLMIPRSINASYRKQFIGSLTNRTDQKNMVTSQTKKKISHQMNDQQNDQFFSRLYNDPIINAKFSGYNIEVLKQIHQSLLSLAFGGQVHFNVESMRDKHSAMQLTKTHFSTLKRHHIQQLMEYGMPTIAIMNFVAKMEHFKPFIINKPTIYDQLGKEHGIAQLASQLQVLITQDYILNISLEKYDIKQRINILARFISQLIQNPELTNTLRQSHKHLFLTHVHFTQLKFYLAQVLYTAKIPLKTVSKILSQMDSFKSLILNKESILDMIEKKEGINYLYQIGGMQDFILTYVKLCQDDPAIQQLISKKGHDKFVKYADIFFWYMFNKHPNLLNLDDMRVLCKGKLDITIQVFNSFKNKALKLVSQLRPDQILFEDFTEGWEEIQQILINRKMNPNQQLQLYDIFQTTFIKSITYEIQQMPILIKIYNDSDVDVENNIMKKIFCLRHHQRYYKKK